MNIVDLPYDILYDHFYMLDTSDLILLHSTGNKRLQHKIEMYIYQRIVILLNGDDDGNDYDNFSTIEWFLICCPSKKIFDVVHEAVSDNFNKWNILLKKLDMFQEEDMINQYHL